MLIVGCGVYAYRDLLCFLGVMVTAPRDTWQCTTRKQIQMKLWLYTEEQLKPGKKPLWTFYRPNGVVPRSGKLDCQYHMLGIRTKPATVCVAYDKKSGRVAGFYEYD